MKIELTLNKRQLDVLLSAIESMLLTDFDGDDPDRGLALLEAALDRDPHEISRDVETLAPVYAEIVRHSTRPGVRPGMAMDGDKQVRWGRWKVQRDAIERVLGEATARAGV
jgi:hypothetical protein